MHIKYLYGLFTLFGPSSHYKCWTNARQIFAFFRSDVVQFEVNSENEKPAEASSNPGLGWEATEFSPGVYAKASHLLDY